MTIEYKPTERLTSPREAIIINGEEFGTIWGAASVVDGEHRATARIGIGARRNCYALT